MFSITCPWLSPHHVTLSRRLRGPSIDLDLNKLIVKFPGLSNQYDIRLSNGYLQLYTSQNTRRIRNEKKRTVAARRCVTSVWRWGDGDFRHTWWGNWERLLRPWAFSAKKSCLLSGKLI